MDSKKKILFIINPKSGIGRQRIAESVISRRLDQSKFYYEIAYTEYAHHGGIIAKDATHNGFDIVVSVGGDGSANDVAQALVNTNTTLGIIPVGSGNGLARFLNIPLTIAGAIDVINAGKERKIDSVFLNDKLFVSIAGLGFDALVAEKFSNSKLRGFISYFKIIFYEYLNFNAQEYKISFEGKDIIRKAIMISLANSDQFGYNARISPKALIDDGYVDICIVKRISIAAAIIFIPRLFLKNMHKSKYVEILRVKEAEITCEQSISSHIDGDMNNRINKAIIKVAPLSLNVIIP